MSALVRDTESPSSDVAARIERLERELDTLRRRQASIATEATMVLQREREIARREERLDLVLDALSDCVWDWDLKTGAEYVSPRYYAMLGYEPNELPATYETWRTLVHPDDLTPTEAALRENLDKGAPFSLEFRMRSKRGEWRWVHTEANVAERDAQGRATRLVGSHNDFTERKRAESRLRASEARFKGIHEMAAVGILQADLAGRIVSINPYGCELVGQSAKHIVGRSLFELVHPDDLASVMQTVATLAHGLSNNRRSERRVVRPDGTIVWVELNTTAIRPGDDRDTMLLIAAVDVTERRQIEVALRESEEKYRALFESAGDAVVVHDMRGQFLAVNELACRQLGYTREELLELDVHSIGAPEMADKSAQLFERIHRDGGATFEMEHVCKDQSRLPVWIKSSLVEYEGQPAIMNMVRDITEQKRLEGELRRMASIDPLTGLANRRHFMERLTSEAARSRRHQRPLSLLIVDVDHFKRINDSHGHPAGDAALKALGAASTSVLRHSDSIGRFGGEEFAVLLPETDLDGAVLLAERVRSKLARQVVRHGKHAISYTVSIGGATWSGNEDDVERLIKRADEALYEAKRTGRNRVVVRRGSTDRRCSTPRLPAVAPNQPG